MTDKERIDWLEEAFKKELILSLYALNTYMLNTDEKCVHSGCVYAAEINVTGVRPHGQENYTNNRSYHYNSLRELCDESLQTIVEANLNCGDRDES